MSDASLLIRGTLQLYAEALRESARALVRHAWLIGLVPAYTLLLQLVRGFAAPLGFAGGFLVFLAAAACASSFLALIGDAVAHQRIRFDTLGETFGRYLGRLIGVFFVFWIVQLLLQLIVQRSPELLWLSIAINTGIFLLFNPVPELVYQSSSESFELLERAVQFMRENTLEWLLPLALLLSPFFAINPQSGFLVMAQLDVSNALDMVIAVLSLWLPGGAAGLALAALLASVLLVWVMLFRGFLFRSLARSGRRRRIYEARARGE
jgi:hypothetical protein